MNSPLYHLIIINFKQYFREPGVLFWSFLFPIVMAWVLGIAFVNKGEIVKTVALVAPGNAGNELIADLTRKTEIRKGKDGEGRVRFSFIRSTREEAILSLKRGKITLFLEKEGERVNYYFDPANPEAELTYLLLEKSLKEDGRFFPQSRVVPLVSKGTRYIDFFIPGLIGMGIMNSCMWGIGWVLIELRQKKLLRRMVATPMKKPVYLLSQFLTRLVLTGLESLLLFAFAYYYFGVEIQGSVPALLLVLLAGNIAFAGMAILSSSRTANSQIGNGIINAVTIPMMILSGIFFSYHNFPGWSVPIVAKLPLTMLADATRSIFIEGAGLAEVAVSVLTLIATGTACFFAGLKAYKWY